MRRTVGLLALALVAGGCGTAATPGGPLPPARAAEPQHAELRWRESFPAAGGGRLVFEVEELDVTAAGWSVAVAVTNRTGTRFAVDTGPADYAFGLMLFPTGDLEAAQRANREGRLPPVREARRIVPAPPPVLQPGVTWRATLSASGALADGSWVRVVFGTFRGQDEPPAEFERVVWFTDRSYRL